MSETRTSKSLAFTVYGKPVQMGSKKAFVVGKRAIITDDNSRQRKSWANAVASVAAEEMKGMELVQGPVEVRARFFFARPQSHYGSGRNASTLKPNAPKMHAQSPDVDKLVRCLNDAMTGIVYRDDRQIVSQFSGRYWTEEQERCEVEVIVYQ